MRGGGMRSGSFGCSSGQDGPSTSQAARLLARGARAGHGPAAQQLFEAATALAPDTALPWLWLAIGTERLERVDARIKLALDLEFGPPSWRAASGELLLVLGLRRLPERPDRAREILFEASFALPVDARVWMAMAATTTTPEARIPYLERALDMLREVPDALRAELVSALVGSAKNLLADARPRPASELLVRAAMITPIDERLWALAVHVAPTGSEADVIRRRAVIANHDDATFDARMRSSLLQPDQWWTRTYTRAPEGQRERDIEGLALLSTLHASLDATCSTLQTYRSLPFQADLLRSAADLTDPDRSSTRS